MSTLRVGQTLTNIPALPGSWSVWSAAGGYGPGAYFVLPEGARGGARRDPCRPEEDRPVANHHGARATQGRSPMSTRPALPHYRALYGSAEESA